MVVNTLYLVGEEHQTGNYKWQYFRFFITQSAVMMRSFIDLLLSQLYLY